jgi:hypothetical protein
MWRHVFRWKTTYVSEEFTASIFRDKDEPSHQQEASGLHYIPADNTHHVRTCFPDNTYGPSLFTYVHVSTYSQLALHIVVHRMTHTWYKRYG